MKSDTGKAEKRMGLWRSLGYFTLKILPGAWNREVGETKSPNRYLRMWRFSVLITAGVALIPLLATSAFDYYQFRQTFRDDMTRPIRRQTSSTKQAMEFFLTERRSALGFIIRNTAFEELADEKELDRILRDMKRSFGGFVDLGLIDSKGVQISYSGPFELRGKNYRNQDWFNEVWLRGVYVSDVFTGHREIPHFVIAVKHEKDDGDFYILRAAIDTELLNRRIFMSGLQPSADAFIINRAGILQSPSRLFGNALSSVPFTAPGYSKTPEIIPAYEIDENSYIFGYAFIEYSPFILIIMDKPQGLIQSWLVLRMIFLTVSVAVILILITGTSAYLVAKIRDADYRQAKALQGIQHTDKMASIGRLAAGVAHEVNNPLAIINEKTGLAKDLISLSKDFPERERFTALLDSVLASVNRCSMITRRLLGFAKRMDTYTEKIELDYLIHEVLGFLEKEVSYRNISVRTNVEDDLPTIESDRGQLQQVFLNIINNAIEELDYGGEIEISIAGNQNGGVGVRISDNGRGIPEENLKRVFDPFFTTKRDHGTGLGLSITYGIVEKLGGTITVESEVNEGTSFVVDLPLDRPIKKD
jgi:signal transduction histidine kinase